MYNISLFKNHTKDDESQGRINIILRKWVEEWI
jgi:hypothetical protein